MDVRNAREDDLIHIPGIELSAAQAFRGRDIPPSLLTEVAPADHWRPHLATGTLWVVAGDGEPVAFLAATAHGDRLHIDEIDVRQDQQGRGLGRRLMVHVTAWAQTASFARLSLTTFRDVPWNAPFYASMGFVEDHALPELQAILKAEAQRGLSNRCAMVKPL